MGRAPSRKETTFLILITLGMTVTFLNMFENSLFKYPKYITGLTDIAERLKVEATDDNNKMPNTKKTLDSYPMPSQPDHLDENISKPVTDTESFLLTYSEQKKPMVKVYDFVPGKVSNAERQLKFEKVQKWLKNIPKLPLQVKPVCLNMTKKILWFDVWHGGKGVRNKARKVDFSKCECRCELDFFIFNNTHKTYDPFDGDAVLIQLNKMDSMGHPPRKRDGQVFVAVEREATPRAKIPLRNFEYIFNWTMTFRRDSDIFYPYGRILNQTDPRSEKNYTEIFKRKKKGIVWFVSHCNTRSKREVYAEELSKYIDFDVVGKCGTLQCPRHGKGASDCLPKFEEEYSFRFTFENTYHRDYVTEKLFDHFSKEMIQIVGGSAEYDNIIPEDTVIIAKDFDSPKTLAMYLKILMENEERYTDYLKRKDNYYAETLHDQSQRAYCQLCSMLHNQDRYRNLYYDVGDWFVS